MKIRGNLQADIDASQLAKRIPPRFKAVVDCSLVSASTVDLIIFPPDDRYVVNSKNLVTTLETRHPSEAQLIVVGYDFTSEARENAAALGGLIFSVGSSFGWTDEMWDSIHESGAT